MEVFRISAAAFANKLTTSGSANRWNLRGEQVLYAGASRSLSTLELVVHRGSIIPTATFKVMVISIPDDDSLIKQIFINELPPNWRTLAAYPVLQSIGSGWYRKKETLILKVPSAVIINEYNYVINATHPNFNHIQLVRTEDYFWDNRLL